ncbi:MAG: FAD:protein FMN transferase [Hydrogenothermaceae bacterium]|nr:FAD:protein FMN transferase [Hydrogenothermaceae bacterium]
MVKIIYLMIIIFSLTAFGEEKVFNVMGTYLIVDTKKYNYEIYRYISYLDKILSDYRDDSDIEKINSVAGKECVEVSPETLEVIKQAVYVSELTGGYFDITVGSVTINYKRKNILPRETAFNLIDYRNIKIENNKVCLTKEGMAIDLGGIGKGYAVEKAYQRYKDKLPTGFIAIAGDLKVWGQKRRLGIYNPQTKDILAEVINKKDVCLSTSGNYFQDHIIGKPTEILQITVAYTDCSITDALSTGIFSMDRENREKFLKDNQDFGVFILFKDGSIWFNSKFRSYFDIILR